MPSDEPLDQSAAKRKSANAELAAEDTSKHKSFLWKSAAITRVGCLKLARSCQHGALLADQIEQEFADELQNMSLQGGGGCPNKKPVLERGFSEIDPHNEAAARGTSAQKQGSFSAGSCPTSRRTASRSSAPRVRGTRSRGPSRSATRRLPSRRPRNWRRPPARTFTEPERPFPPTEPASKKDAVKAARDAIEVGGGRGPAKSRRRNRRRSRRRNQRRRRQHQKRRSSRRAKERKNACPRASASRRAQAPSSNCFKCPCGCCCGGVRRGLPLHSTEVGRDAVDRPARGRLRGALQQACGIGGHDRR